jgi:predicted KAP-like P-loop ATPase
VGQDQAIILSFKIVEISAVIAILIFTTCYTRWARWYKNPVGRTIVFEGIAIILVLIPSILSIFVNLNRLTSRIAAWYAIGSFALVPVLMLWRTFVFWKIHRTSGKGRDDDS